LFLLDGTEADPGADHDSIEVTVSSGDTLHGTGTPYEGLSGGLTDWLQCWWRPAGHLGTEGDCVGGKVGGEVGGEVGGKVLCKVLLDVNWSRCGLPREGLWSGIARDGTSAKADVGAAIKAAESGVETVNIRGAGTPT